MKKVPSEHGLLFPSLLLKPIFRPIPKRSANDIAKQRAELECDLIKAPADLQRLIDEATRLRENPPPELVAAYMRMKQAELDSGRMG